MKINSSHRDIVAGILLLACSLANILGAGNLRNFPEPKPYDLTTEAGRNELENDRIRRKYLRRAAIEDRRIVGYTSYALALCALGGFIGTCRGDIGVSNEDLKINREICYSQLVATLNQYNLEVPSEKNKLKVARKLKHMHEITNLSPQEVALVHMRCNDMINCEKEQLQAHQYNWMLRSLFFFLTFHFAWSGWKESHTAERIALRDRITTHDELMRQTT